MRFSARDLASSRMSPAAPLGCVPFMGRMRMVSSVRSKNNSGEKLTTSGPPRLTTAP